MTKPVLVTSAAGGRQGKTGRHVSEMLLKRGVPVRAFVRTLDDRAQQLRALGAEIFEGDFLDIRSVQRAAEGTSAIYFAYPVQDGLMDATTIMARAAREAGVKRLVNLVMLQSSPATSGSTVFSLPQGRRIAPCAGRLCRTIDARFS